MGVMWLHYLAAGSFVAWAGLTTKAKAMEEALWSVPLEIKPVFKFTVFLFFVSIWPLVFLSMIGEIIGFIISFAKAWLRD